VAANFDAGTTVASAVALTHSADIAVIFADQYMSESGAGHRQSGHYAVINQVAGVMEAWYLGIAGGKASANLLFGTVASSGKLPIRFPESKRDLPHERIFGIAAPSATKNDLLAQNDLLVNWVVDGEKRQLFYKYSDLRVDISAKSVSFTIKNVGCVSGTEIAEIYVGLPKASSENFRRVAGWQRLDLAAGQEKSVTVALEPLAVAPFDEKKDAWIWRLGLYTVSVGVSSRDLPLQSTVALY